MRLTNIDDISLSVLDKDLPEDLMGFTNNIPAITNSNKNRLTGTNI